MARMADCRACHANVAKAAKWCVACGQPWPGNRWWVKWAVLLAVLAVVLYAAWAYSTGLEMAGA